MTNTSVRTVGTAPETVGQVASMTSAMGPPCRNCCGMTRSAPAAQAAYGMPQALAWNWGTINRMRSAKLMPRVCDAIAASECRYEDRCE